MSICGLRTFGEGAGFPFPARIAGGRFGRGNDVVALDALHCRKIDIRCLTRFRNSGRKNVRAFMTRLRVRRFKQCSSLFATTLTACQHRDCGVRASEMRRVKSAIAVLTCRQGGGKKAGDGRFDRVSQRPLRACEHCKFQFSRP